MTASKPKSVWTKISDEDGVSYVANERNVLVEDILLTEIHPVTGQVVCDFILEAGALVRFVRYYPNYGGSLKYSEDRGKTWTHARMRSAPKIAKIERGVL